jgi:hypothetical protein
MDNSPAELTRLEAAVDRFFAQPVPQDGPALACYLERLQRVNDKLLIKSSEAGVAFAETDHYDEHGFCSPLHWIRVNLHLTGGGRPRGYAQDEAQKVEARSLSIKTGEGRRWPGCDRTATWTDGHHLKHWIGGGGGDLANLVLLCARHHWMAHEGKWQLVKTDDGKYLAIPPQLDLYQRFRPARAGP